MFAGSDTSINQFLGSRYHDNVEKVHASYGFCCDCTGRCNIPMQANKTDRVVRKLQKWDTLFFGRWWWCAFIISRTIDVLGLRTCCTYEEVSHSQEKRIKNENAGNILEAKYDICYKWCFLTNVNPNIPHCRRVRACSQNVITGADWVCQNVTGEGSSNFVTSRPENLCGSCAVHQQNIL